MSRILGPSLETLDMEAMARDARKALKDIGLNIEEYATVAGLPVGHMQFMEIAREIDKIGIKFLVFDEPTAVLTESEAENLLQTMRLIAQKGIAIIFITHRLGEVMDYADNITVLRDGELVASKAVKDTNVLEIAELMIGRKVDSLVDPGEDTRTLADEDIAMSIRDLCGDARETVGASTWISAGAKSFGIGGLAGQGKLELPTAS